MSAGSSRLDQILRLAKTKLVQGAGIAFAAQACGLALNYVLNIFLARFLGPHEYGVYVFALSWLSLLAVPSTLGFTTSVIKLVPEYAASGAYGLLKGALRYSTVVAFLGGVVFTVLSVGVYLGIVTLKGGTLDVVLLTAFGSIPLLGLANLESSKLRGFKHIGRSMVPIRVVRPALLLALIVGFGLVNSGNLRALDAMLLHLIVLVIIVIAYRVLTHNTMPAAASSEKVIYERRQWIRLSLPLLLVATFSLLLSNTDIIMVGLLSEVEQVAFYSVSARTANVIGLALLAANSIAAPMFAELHAAGRQRDFQILINKTCLLIIALTLPIALVVFFFSGLILSFFGEAFGQATAILFVLAAGHLVNAAAGSVGVVLDMTGHGRDTARVFGASVLINLVLNALLIPSHGALGAAIATAATMILWNVTLVYLVARRLQLGVGLFSLASQAVRGGGLWK